MTCKCQVQLALLFKKKWKEQNHVRPYQKSVTVEEGQSSHSSNSEATGNSEGARETHSSDRRWIHRITVAWAHFTQTVAWPIFSLKEKHVGDSTDIAQKATFNETNHAASHSENTIPTCDEAW